MSGNLPESSELVIGLVAPIGTDLQIVYDVLQKSLAEVAYACQPVRLSDLLDEIPLEPWSLLKKKPEFERYNDYMDGGNKLRETLGRGDALAMLAVGAMRRIREKWTQQTSSSLGRRAFVLRSLKHPAEAISLREIYGPAFILIAAYSPPTTRLQNLASRLAETTHEFHSNKFLAKAQALMTRDEAEASNRFGQNVREVFPMSDFFVDASETDKLQSAVKRIVELVFGYLFHTPSRDEYGMFHAQAAALRSSSLQRQVGAVVATEEGDIVAVGANEVPKAGGGLYWCGDTPDKRDFMLGYETNDRLKRRMLADVLGRLKDNEWLSDTRQSKDVDELLEEVITSDIMRGAQVLSVIEFGRCVHAEMAALVDAARRGVSVFGATLYSTTFPCHECARHLVAAGIKRVVYIEPYPKSLVPELYPDSIVIEGTNRNNSSLQFEPFVGVSPRRYIDLFSTGRNSRKDAEGRVSPWNKLEANPRLGENAWRTFLINDRTEPWYFAEFAKEMAAKKLFPESVQVTQDRGTKVDG